MALVTRCPKCSTMFRVVPDQLRVSAGWVRCGHCQEVFDAAQHMMPRGSELAALGEAREGGRDGNLKRGGAREANEAREANGAREGGTAVTNSASLLQRREGTKQPAQLPMPESDAANAALPPLPPLPPLPSPDEPPPHGQPDEQPNEPPPPAPAENPPQPTPRRAPGAPNTAFMAELDAARAAVVIGEPAAPPPVPAVVQGSNGQAPQPPQSQRLPQQAKQQPPQPPSEPVDLFLSELGEDLDEGGEAPSFVQRARRRQPASPHMRALLWFGVVALTLALVLQMLISERNWLAARQPAFAPVLRGLCSVFGCRVEPYRHIDAIVIDNSGFSRAVDGSFQFHYSLRNHAGLPVATPALELTLTDALERPLVRRVISARELGAPASIAARGEFSGARTITLSSAANPSAVTGYKLLAFYP